MFDLTRIEPWLRGWRGPLLAALLALLAGLPGALALPTLDRDEARFAQATAQMLETGDFVDIRFQDEPRDKKPVGIHWLQAASVAALSSAEARDIWVYRLPSLLGAMLAAAALAWGGTALLGPVRGVGAGALLGLTFLLSTEAGIAKTDAVLCGTTTLAIAALARLYAAPELRSRRTVLAFWLAMAVALLDKGPIGPMVVMLTGLCLLAWDRRAPWARRLNWPWGLILVLAIAGPWAVAITVKTDGAFWGKAIGSDMAPKLAGGQEGHGAPPGLHALISPLLFFPFAFLLPTALVQAWKARGEPAVRFAICWLVPSWLVFEAAPTKLPHYTLPLYGALAWLAVVAACRPLGRWSRWVGLGLTGLAGTVWIAAVIYLGARYGGAAGWIVLTVLLMLGAAASGVAWLLRREVSAGSDQGDWRWIALAGALGLMAHGALLGGLAPGLQPLWIADQVNALLVRTHLDPRDGLVDGPVAVIGYAEPSLIFTLGTETQLGDASDGGEAIAEGRPVLVEARAEAGFLAELAAEHLSATPAGQVKGFDYSDGKKEVLTLYRSDSPPPQDQATASEPDDPNAPPSSAPNEQPSP